MTLLIIFTIVLVGISVTMLGYSWHISVETKSLKKKEKVKRETIQFYPETKLVSTSLYSSNFEGIDKKTRSSLRYHNSMYLDKETFLEYKSELTKKQFPMQ